MTSVDKPQASWVRDSGEWRILALPHLAKVGERVAVARADGSRLREVTIRDVTTRTWQGRIVCTIH